MRIYLFILENNILPIFLIVSLGFIMSKKFNLDTYTLSKLNFYILVPSFTFVNLYSTKIPVEMLKVVFVGFLLLGINYIISYILSKLSGIDGGLRTAFSNSVMFYNAGNIGIPLITLVFSSFPYISQGETPYLEIAITTQVMILLVQNITINTIGFLTVGSIKVGMRNSIIKILKMPTIYVVPLALILKTFPLDLTEVFIWKSLNYTKDALVPIALLTLGIQLSKTKFDLGNKNIYFSVATRLVVAPIFSFFIIYIFNFTGIIAQVILISSALPTAINTALIAVEYDNHPDFASQTVMTSTIFSAVSLVFIIYLARIVFNVPI